MQFCHGGRAIVFWSVGLRESLLVTVVMFSCSFVFVEFWSRLFFWSFFPSIAWPSFRSFPGAVKRVVPRIFPHP